MLFVIKRIIIIIWDQRLQATFKNIEEANSALFFPSARTRTRTYLQYTPKD